MIDMFLNWWPVVAVVVGVAVNWAVWASRQQFVTHEHLDTYIKAHQAEHKAEGAAHAKVHDQVEAALVSGEVKFRELETRLAQLPTRADHEALLRALGEVNATIQGIGAKVDGLATSVSWVQSNLSTIVDHELAEGRQAKAQAQGHK